MLKVNLNKVDIMNKNKIGILLISTWKYNKFIDPTIQQIRKFFFKNSKVVICLHTDSEENHDADFTIKIEHKNWPLITLERFQTFVENQDKYDCDYLFYVDIDTKILKHVNEDILDDFVVTEHSGYVGKIGTPETNPISKAFIPKSEYTKYICGGFFGGKKETFFKVAKLLKENIEADLQKNYIAIWHDESHLNKYYSQNKNKVKILPYSYMYNGTNPQHIVSDPIMIPIHNHEKGFDKFESNNQ